MHFAKQNVFKTFIFPDDRGLTTDDLKNYTARCEKVMKKIPAYRYIGIDPGTNVLGYAIIEIVDKHVRLLDIGVFRMDKLETHPLKLKKIFENSILF